MRNTISLLLCLLLLCLPLAAQAEETAMTESPLILTGKVQAKETMTITAPFGATVKDFTLAAGDYVQAGDTLMTLDTVKVYAPCDGVVRGVFARAGDSAAYVQGRYGALCYIEPAEALTVQAATSQGYNKPENKTLHMGETVYLRGTSDSSLEGVGRITGATADMFSVEVQDSNFEVNNTVNIFRDDDYASESRIGRGIVSSTAPLPVTADGSILSLAVRDGTVVSRGDLLFELVTGTLDGMTPVSASVRAEQAGVVASVSVAPGQMASKGQPLATLYTLDEVQLVSGVSEMDAGRVSVGSQVRIVLDSLPGKAFEGTIRAVSGIGQPAENYSEYTVYVDFTPDESVRLGMSATAYPEN